MKQKSDKISAVISSFDGFSDCWEPMIDSLLKFWPKNFFNIYLITNYLDSPNEQLIPSIKVGRDKGWASNLKYALERIDTKYVIYLQEDFWFTKKIRKIFRVRKSVFHYFEQVLRSQTVFDVKF